MVVVVVVIVVVLVVTVVVVSVAVADYIVFSAVATVVAVAIVVVGTADKPKAGLNQIPKQHRPNAKSWKTKRNTQNKEKPKAEWKTAQERGGGKRIHI